MPRGNATPEGKAAPVESAPASGTDAALVAAGEALYKDAAGCAACHEAKGKGRRQAPDLGDGEWLHVDGSLDQIAGLLAGGGAGLKAHAAPATAAGGARLTGEQVRALAAYIGSLSGKP